MYKVLNWVCNYYDKYYYDERLGVDRTVANSGGFADDKWKFKTGKYTKPYIKIFLGIVIATIFLGGIDWVSDFLALLLVVLFYVWLIGWLFHFVYNTGIIEELRDKLKEREFRKYVDKLYVSNSLKELCNKVIKMDMRYPSWEYDVKYAIQTFETSFDTREEIAMASLVLNKKMGNTTILQNFEEIVPIMEEDGLIKKIMSEDSLLEERAKLNTWKDEFFGVLNSTIEEVKGLKKEVDVTTIKSRLGRLK